MFLKYSHIKAKSEGDLEKICVIHQKNAETPILKYALTKTSKSNNRRMFFAIYEMQ